jgi:uncharacterized protein YlzI (FlbEa/FlbD family)
MIKVHRLTHPDEPIWLNADHIVAVEATPDTVITLDTEKKLLVIENPDELGALVREWEASIIIAAGVRHYDVPVAV